MSTTSASPTGAARRVGAWSDGLVARARVRWGPRYLFVLVMAGGAFMSYVGMPVQTLTALPFWTGEFAPLSTVWMFVVLGVAVGVPAMVLVRLPSYAVVTAHLRGEPADPVAVWRSGVTVLPRVAALTGGVWSLVATGVGLFVVGRREEFDALAWTGAYAAQLLAAAGLAAFALMFFQLALFPVVREVAPYLPADFAETTAVSGRQRLILLNTAITLTVGFQSAGLSLGFMHQGRPWVVAVVVVGIVSTYVWIFLGLAAADVTRRVDELAGALNGMASGRPLRILPSSGDDFDETARAFNTMVDLLEENARELRRSRTRLVEVADEARRRIERDLHDGAQQNLALVSMQLGQLESGSRSQPDLAARVHAIRGDLGAVVAEMRALAHGIYPAALEAEGLGSALRAAARESDVPVHLDLAIATRWPAPVEAAVYFCCWEALQRAGQVEGERDPTVTLRIDENGGSAALLIALDPPLDPEHAVELAHYVADRLGAVGGTSTAGDPARPATLLRGEVPVR
ncbi:sensor histidine kinase [Nocardioides stalactiti]|uniref:sensor histidine kinase n=1 Tax=Nocardioides stalactiti TaxID=2755356 RepID=UPI0015FF1E8D|nr:histidine kinase [Nocardioides stalactiti]